jgi:ATP-dependent DNA helicase RecG
MTSADLAILLQEGEGTTIEYKESLSSSISREITALANTVGGKILLGVRDDGKIIGIRDSNLLRARIQDVARNCDPPVQVTVEPMEKVIVIHVRESAEKPVQCGDGFFWRQGAVTQ